MSVKTKKSLFPFILICVFILSAAGMMYLTLSTPEKQYEMQIGVWKTLAAFDHAPSEYKLGMDLFQKDPKSQEALAYVTEAGEHGLGVAENFLGWWYDEHPQNKGNYDFEKAEYWYKKADAKNIVTSTHNLGRLYIKTKQYNRVEEPLLKAANMGWVNAQNTLGSWYENENNPNGVSIDNALIWYGKAAKSGHDMAMHNYAHILSGKGEYKDAIEWYEKAYEAGKKFKFNDSAQGLGYIYHKAKDPAFHDHHKALHWYNELAKSGEANDLYQSALYYIRTRDKEERINPQSRQGMIWMREAAEKGNEKAIKSIEDKRRNCLEYSGKYRRYGCEMLSMAGYEYAALYSKIYDDSINEIEKINAISRLMALATVGDFESIITVLSFSKYALKKETSISSKKSLLGWYYVLINNFEKIASEVPKGVAAEYRNNIEKAVPDLVSAIGDKQAVEIRKCVKFYRIDKKRFFQCI